MGLLLIILFGIFIGFLIDKEISWKKKIFFFLILLIIFIPPPIYSNSVKNNDEKIINENQWAFNFWIKDYPNQEDWKGVTWNWDVGGQYYISSHEIYDKISLFQELARKECYGSSLISETNLVSWNSIKKTKEFQDCINNLYMYDKNFCIKEIAIKTNNVNICDAYPEKKFTRDKLDCITWVAYKLNDPTICDKIEDTTFNKSYCSEVVVNLNKAINEKNILLCKNIPSNDEDTMFQQECELLIGEGRSSRDL